MTMSSKEKPEEMEWSTEEEIQLLFALEGLKPVGVNKYFFMALIAKRLYVSLNREIPAKDIWVHLKTLYNLDVLDELEALPFPNEQTDFCLPDGEYSSLMSKKRAEIEEQKNDNKVDKSLMGKQIISSKELEKKIAAKLIDGPKRTHKRTRGSMSLESNSSPSTTPPPMPSNKRRRI